MRNRAIWYWHLFLIVFLVSLPALQTGGFGQELKITPAPDRREFAFKERIQRIQQAAKALQELAGRPLPANLSANERQEALKFAKWLQDSSQRLNDLADRGQQSLSKISREQGSMSKEQGSMSAQTTLTEMEQTFGSQHLELQGQLENQSRQLGSLSGISKTMHEQAKSIIANMR